MTEKLPSAKTCEIMQYLDYTPNIKTADDVVKIALSLTNIKTVCAIIHDKDTKTDGTPKAPHFHAVLTFSNNANFGTIARAFGIEPQYINKIKTTTKTAQLYLIHANHPNKFQYDVSAVSANFDYVNKVDNILSSEHFDFNDILNRINTGEIRRYNYTNFIDIYNYDRYKRRIDNALQYKDDCIKMEVNRKLDTIFITGMSGTGKTTLAKQICKDHNYSAFISDGGKDPLDGYGGQDAIIFDDLRASDYKFNEFLKLTDNNTASQAHSRYYNKSLAWCKLMIITSTVNFDNWYQGLQESGNGEQFEQFERRFPTRVHLTETEMWTEVYFNGKIIPLKTRPNPTIIFREETLENAISKAADLIGVCSEDLKELSKCKNDNDVIEKFANIQKEIGVTSTTKTQSEDYYTQAELNANTLEFK